MLVAKKTTTKKQSPLVTLLAVVVILLALGYYIATGEDPLGLFDETSGGTNNAPVQLAPPSVGSGGDWWQVRFTNPDPNRNPDDISGSLAEELIGYINRAERRIDIAAFEFNLDPVAEALIAAHEREVAIRWVTDDEHGIEADEEEDHGQFAMLEAAGIEVRDDARSALMHNKFWIFDEQTVWTGSTNITRNGVFLNNNNVIVIESTPLAAIYEREFEELWRGESGPTSPSTLRDQRVEIEGTTIQVLFAAEDEVVDQLLPLIAGAQERIQVMAFAFTEDNLGQAILERAEAGVAVQGIFEVRGSETEFSEMGRLYCAGLPVRQDGNPRTFHHKVIVIDGNLVVTGSLNFSENANESNDENVLIVGNRDIAALYQQEFERRWQEATPPDDADIRCDN